MNKKIFFEWSSSTIIITVVFGVILLGILIYLFKTISFKDPFELWGGKFITALLLIGAEIYFSSTTPLYIKYSESEICIKKIIGSKKFPYNEIDIIKNIEPQVIAGSTRKVGSGGMGGYTGLFHNSTLGNYYMYVTAKQDLILIETKSKKYVFNCPDRDNLVNFVKAHTPKQ